MVLNSPFREKMRVLVITTVGDHISWLLLGDHICYGYYWVITFVMVITG